MVCAGFVVVSALPNDSRYVSPASTRAASPMGSRGGSFTAKGAPAKSSQSDQSAQSTGPPNDTADSATSGNALSISLPCAHPCAVCIFASSQSDATPTLCLQCNLRAEIESCECCVLYC